MDNRTRAWIAGGVVALVAAVVIVIVVTGDDETPEVADTPTADDPEAAEPEAADEEATEPDEPAEADGDDGDEPQADDGVPDAPAELATEVVADGFAQPWGLAFLPDSSQLLVTELPGRLSVVDTETGEVTSIDGAPEVLLQGQGGLLDVEVAPDFDNTGWIYLTYSATDQTGGSGTHLARARLDLDAQRLDDLEPLFVAQPLLDGAAQHFGSRVVVGDDGYLYVTIGDRGSKEFDDHPSQDPSNHLGTTVRLAPDGSVPDDNPFVDDPDVADEIYTWGHRNVQGMAVHPETGEIWQSEHGEEDGDEINVLEAGSNYGWPITHTGCEYGTDTPVGEHPEDRDDVVNPRFYWECTTGGFPPGGIAFATGEMFPSWEGDLFVTSLAAQALARFSVDGDGQLTEEEWLLEDEGWRLRDVAVGPDGALYLAVDSDDAPIVRVSDPDRD